MRPTPTKKCTFCVRDEEDCGQVLGGCGETPILDVRLHCDVLSMFFSIAQHRRPPTPGERLGKDTEAKNFAKLIPGLLKSSLGAFKIEPGGLQDDIFKQPLTQEGQNVLTVKFLGARMTNVAPIWRPKRLENRVRNP